MNTKQTVNMPKALSEVRCQLDHWRSQRSNKRTRLPKEFRREAVILAKVHGLNKTARVLNVKYYSLKKHLDQANLDEGCSAKHQPDFIELLPGTMKPGGVECMIEWADGHNATVRMTEFQKHTNELSSHPERWMPWNYQDKLQRTDGTHTRSHQTS